MSSLGLSPFRIALLFEICGNISTLPALFIRPDFVLGMLVDGPHQITPAARTLTQVLGCIVATLTVPLILAWPNPKAGAAGEQQRGLRKTAYGIQGVGEALLAPLFITHYLAGSNCGWSRLALLQGAVTMAALLSLRWVFLFWKPHLLEDRAPGKGSAKTH